MKVSVPLPVYDPAGHKMAVYQLTVPSGETQYCICGSTTTLWFAGQVLGADRLGSLSYFYPYGETTQRSRQSKTRTILPPTISMSRVASITPRTDSTPPSSAGS